MGAIAPFNHKLIISIFDIFPLDKSMQVMLDGQKGDLHLLIEIHNNTPVGADNRINKQSWGPFNKYVDRFYGFFDQLPTPRRQFIY